MKQIMRLLLILSWSFCLEADSSRTFYSCAHRGASGYAPENTLAAFAKAVELSATMIEFDVHQCASGDLVVIHDERVDRTTNGKGYVRDLTLVQLKELDIQDQKIPTLRETLDLIDRKAIVNIELKGVGTARAVASLIGEYIKKKGWKSRDFVVSSFRLDELEQFRALMPTIKLSILSFYVPSNYQELIKKIHAFSLNLPFFVVSCALVSQLHKQGVAVFVWTLNDADKIQYFRKMGVDGIISDYPDRLNCLEQ